MSYFKRILYLIFYLLIIPKLNIAQNSVNSQEKLSNDEILLDNNVDVYFFTGIYRDSIVHIVWENYDQNKIKQVVLESSDDGINFILSAEAVLSTLTDLHQNNYPKNINRYNNILMSTEHGNVRYIYNDVIKHRNFDLHPKWYRLRMVTFSGNTYISQTVTTKDSEKKDCKAPSNIIQNSISNPIIKEKAKSICPSVTSPPSGYTVSSQVQTNYGDCCYWTERLYESTNPVMTDCGDDSYAWCCNNVPGAGSCTSGYVSDPCCVHYCDEYGDCSCTPWQCCTSSTISQWVITESVQYSSLALSPIIQNETCAGMNNGSISLTVSNGTGTINYLWSGGQTTSTITGLSGGSYNVTVTDANNCQVTASYTVTVNPLPTINGTLTMCAGSTVQLTGSGTAALINPWTSSNTNIASVSNTGFVTFITPGTSLITYTDNNGCSNTVSVTVNQMPTITGSLNVCAGLTTQLTGTGTPAALNPWVSIDTSVATINNTGLVTGVSAGTSIITLTLNNGCSISTTVTVNANPVLNIIPNNPVICFEDSIIITANGANTYSWSPAVGLSSSSGATIHASPPQTTTYTVTGASGASCLSTTTFTLIVYPIPTSDFTFSAPNCTGNTATITYTGTATSSANYTWGFSGGSASPGTGQGPHQVVWSSPGSYDVSLVVTENNCVSLQTIHTVPVSDLSVNQPTHTNVICYAESNGTATVFPVNGSTPYFYQWSTNPSQTSQTASNLCVGIYYVTVTDNVGCIAYDTVQVFQPDILDLNVSYENERCLNSCDGYVSVSVTGGILPYLYDWTGSSLHTAEITNLCVGNYTVTVSDSNNCTVTGNALIITNSPIYADAIVDSRTIYLPMTVTFYFTGSGATDYLWDFGDGTTSNLPNPSHHFSTAGDFAVLLIVNSGAPDYCSDSMYIIITVVLPSKVTIPNVFTPNGDEANDRFKVESEGLETEEMMIYNRWGKLIFSWSEVGGEWDGHNANGKEEADGTYYYVYAAKGYDGKYFKFNGSVTLIR